MVGSQLDARAWIGRLVAFDTTSRNSNLGLIEFVADYLSGYGVSSTLTHDDDGGKANLFATLGPDVPGGIVLSGHTDVVPVDGQDWESDPFAVVEREGLLFGRGTSDMKSFLAVALALVPEFLDRDLVVPLHLAFSYDEEVGCIGVPRLIADIRQRGIKPGLAIVGEPTNMRVVNAHKGIHGFTTTVRGREAHSSATHRGVSAVMVAAQLIAYLNRLADDMRVNADPDNGFDPPYTTVQVGTIEGGTAINIIPKLCRFAWEYRDVPGSDGAVLERFSGYAAEVEAQIRRIAPEAAITTEAGARVPPLLVEDNSSAEALARALTGDNASAKASFGTEAGLFQMAGIPAVVCGPGSVDQAHKPNEFIHPNQVEACANMLRRLMARMCDRERGAWR